MALSWHLIPERWRNANAYLISCDACSLLIDPAVPLNKLPEGQVPTLLLATHGHYDHIHQFLNLRNETGAAFILPWADAPLLKDEAANCSSLFGTPETYPEADRYVKHEEVIELSEDCRLTVLHTPGHSPGSSCYLLTEREEGRDVPRLFFSGDTLFAHAIGRTDLPGGDPDQMEESLRFLRAYLKELPPDLLVLPGHAELIRVGDILVQNPYLRS